MENNFPVKCVEHIAKRGCQCQVSALDVDLNRHYRSCMVGQAQKYLGKKVTEKKLYA